MSDNVIRVYCPEQADITAFVEGYLMESNGGTTTYQAEGQWLDENDHVDAESVDVVESVTDSDTPGKDAKEAAAAAKRQDWHNEDCIMWEVRPVTAMGYE